MFAQFGKYLVAGISVPVKYHGEIGVVGANPFLFGAKDNALHPAQTLTIPFVAEVEPAIIFASVDFPLPFSPRSPSDSPLPSSKLISRRA